MKLLLPFASKDRFFREEEYNYPKFLVDVAGTPMLQRALENLSELSPDLKVSCIALADDARRFNLANVVRRLGGEQARVLTLGRPTAGAMCTCLMAADDIDPDEPLVIANIDQVIDGLGGYFRALVDTGADAGVLTFDSVHPRWSYVRTEGDTVIEAAEKSVISRDAIAGFYYFRRGGLFLDAAFEILRAGSLHSDEYFTSGALNQLVLDGHRVAAQRVANTDFHTFYSPKSLEEYERHALDGHGSPSRPGVQLVIPMAGRGQRFADAGYVKPKPFIELLGRTMIEHVLDNLSGAVDDIVLVARKQHLEHEAEAVARLRGRPNVRICAIDDLTEGAPCTVLLARGLLDPGRPCLIANCDQLIDFEAADFVADARRRNLDGSILVFRDADLDTKWSFAEVDTAGLVTRTAEKIPISDLATVGLYYFRRTDQMVDWIVDMMAANDRTNGEFYSCPAYNYGIARRARIGIHEIPRDAMHGIGTPQDLEAFLKRKRSA
jgi:NDP-sugar pyrophosphorylase family protein